MTENIVFLFISLVTSGITWYLYAVLRASGLRDRRMRGFDALCILVPFWILLTAITDIAEPEVFPTMYVLTAFPLNVVPYLSCWFLLNFAESKAADSRLIQYFSIGMPVIAIALLLTNPLHNMYLLSFGNPPAVGPAFIAHLAVSTCYMLVVYVILFRYVVKNYRSNPFLAVGGIGAFIPVIIYIIFLFLDDIISHDYTPIGYFFTIVFVSYASYYTRLRNARPGYLGNTLADIAKSPEITSGTLAEAARLIAKEGCTALGAYRVRIWQYDGKSQTLKCIACYNNSVGDYTAQEDFSMQGVAMFDKYLASERIVAFSDAKKAEAEAGMANTYDPEVCAVLLAPVRIDRNPVGVVCVEQNYSAAFPEKREWSFEEQSFAASLSDIMEIAAVNTERRDLMRQLEEELSHSTEFNRASIKNAPIGLAMFDNDFGILECNDALLSMFGVTKEFFCENFPAISPEYQPDGQSSHKKWMTLKEEVRGKGKVKFEWMHQTSDGEPVPCEVTLISVKQGEGGTGLAYVYDLRDITRMDKDLHETTMQLRAVLENYPGLIYCVDKNESVVLFDGILPRKAGILAGQYSGRKFADIDFGLCNDEGKSFVQKTFSEGMQEWISEFDGKTFRALTVPVLDDDGDTVYVVGSIADITEIARLNNELEDAVHKANEANKAKSEFLAKMSHEMRTPMNAIIGMTELALRGSEPGEMIEHIHTIKQAASNLLAIINDILDFSKIEAGKMEIIPGVYSIASLLNDVVSIIRMRAVESHVHFAVKADAGIPHMLHGDETKIRQAVLNVLGNAVKYTEKGFVSLSVYGDFIDDNTMSLVFEVTDSGIGIRTEDINKLFIDFSQLDIEKNRGIEGIGLGLAIAHSIVRAMGGEITVKSEYGTGSKFTITIPQKFYTREPLAKVEQPEKKRVLVYESRDVHAESICYSVSNLGAECTTVASEAELLGKLESGLYSYLFISFPLYVKHEDALLSFGKDVKTVILAEFGEAVPEKYINTISLPVYCTYIAGVLNGVRGGLSYVPGGDTVVKFSAPEARILIVDDIRTNLKVAEGLIKPYNMQIDLCSGGAEAVDAVQAKSKTERYDLVFMDHKMPKVDGVEATKRIRALGEHDPYFKDVPIIALTANAVSGIMDMYLQSGFNDYLFKPIDMVKLNSILEKWIPAHLQHK